MTPDQAHHVFVLSILVLATVLLVVAMRTFAGRRPGKCSDGSEEHASLSAIQADVAQLKLQLASVEQLLRQVG